MARLKSKGGAAKKRSRKKLLLILLPILVIVGLAGGFFLNQMLSTYEEPTDSLLGVGKSDVMPKPESGTPADYTPAENAAIALYVLQNTEHYRTEKVGKVTGKVGFISTDQEVKNQRIVNGSEIFTQSISMSSMVQVGEQQYVDNGIYLLKIADKVNSVDDPVWNDQITALSPDAHEKRYGAVQDGLSNYIISQDTILSSEYLGESDGNYTFSFELDPDKSSAYYRREVKTMSGSEKIPLFHSVKVKITINEEWQPQQVEVEENYDVAIPVVGTANCTGVLVEDFLDYGVETPIPNRDAFVNYIENEYDPENLSEMQDAGETDMMSYLSKVFDTDENGKATLAIDISLNGGAAQRAYLEIDTQNMVFKFKWGDLVLGYENSRIYLAAGDNIKYYLKQTDLMDAAYTLSYQLGLDLSDMDSLMSQDTLGQLMQHVGMKSDGGVQIIEFNMDGLSALIRLDAGQMKFLDMSASVDLGGFQADIAVAPAATQEMPVFDDSYQDMQPVLEFVDPIIQLIQAKTYAFRVDMDVAGALNLKQSAEVRVTRTSRGVNLQVDSNLNGKWLHVKVVEGNAYISYGNLKFLLRTDDIAAISEQIQRFLPETGFDLSAVLPQSYVDLFTNLDVQALVNCLKSIELSEGNLNVQLQIGEDPISIHVGAAGDMLSSAYLHGVTLLDSEVNINARMTAVSDYVSVITVDDAGYTDLSGITGFVAPIANLIDARTYEFDTVVRLQADGSTQEPGSLESVEKIQLLTNSGVPNLEQTAHVKLVRGETGLSAQVTTPILGRDLDVRLVDGVTYAQYGNVKVKLALADAQEVIRQLQEAIPQLNELDLTDAIPQTYVDFFQQFDIGRALESIQAFRVNGNRAELVIRLGEDAITLSAQRSGENLESVRLEGVSLLGSRAALSLEGITTSADTTPVTVDPAGFADAKDVVGFVRPILDLVEATSYDLTLQARVAGEYSLEQEAHLQVSRTETGANLTLTAPVSGMDLIVKYIDGVAYAQYGNIKIRLDTEDIAEITEEIQKVLPEDAQTIDLAEILPQAYVDLLTGMDPVALVDAIQSLEVTADTAALTLQVGEDTIVVEMAKADGQMQSAGVTGLTVLNHDVSVSAAVNRISDDAILMEESGEGYVDARELVEFLPAVTDLLDAKSYEIEWKLDLEQPFALNQFGTLRLVRTETGADMELITPIEGENLVVRFIDQVAYLQYGNLKFKLDTRDMDEILAVVQQILPDSMKELKWQDLVPERYLHLIENPDIPALLQSVQTFALEDGTLSLSALVEEETVSFSVTKDAQGLREAAFRSSEYGGIRATLKAISQEPWEITVVDEGYIDIADLLPFLEPIIHALQAQSYTFDANIDVKQADGSVWMSVPAHVAVERTEYGLNAEINTVLFGQNLNLKLIGNQYFVSYGNLAVHSTQRDLKELERTIQRLLPNQATLDLTQLLSKPYQRLFITPSLGAWLQAIREFTIEGDTATLTMKIGSDTVQLAITTNGETYPSISLTGVTVLDGKIGIDAWIQDLQFGQESLGIAPDAIDYIELRDILDFIPAIEKTLAAKSWEFVAEAEMAGQVYEFQVQLTRNAEGGVDFLVEADLDGQPLRIVRVGDQNYITVGSLKVAMEDADIAKINAVLQKLMPTMGSWISGFDLSSILPQEYLDFFENPDIATMLSGLQKLWVDEDTITIGYLLGGDLLELSITRGASYLESLSLEGMTFFQSDAAVRLYLENLSDQTLTIRPENPDEYIWLGDILECLDPLIQILDSTDCIMQLTVLERHEITIQKSGYMLYLEYGNVRISMDVRTVDIGDIAQKVMDLMQAAQLTETKEALEGTSAPAGQAELIPFQPVTEVRTAKAAAASAGSGLDTLTVSAPETSVTDNTSSDTDNTPQQGENPSSQPSAPEGDAGSQPEQEPSDEPVQSQPEDEPSSSQPVEEGEPADEEDPSDPPDLVVSQPEGPQEDGEESAGDTEEDSLPDSRPEGPVEDTPPDSQGQAPGLGEDLTGQGNPMEEQMEDMMALSEEEMQTLDLLGEISLGQILQTLQEIAVDVQTKTASITFQIEGQPMTFSVSQDEEGKGMLRLSGEDQTYVDLRVESISGSMSGGDDPQEKPEAQPDEDGFGEYVDINELTPFLDPITNILNARSYSFDLYVDMQPASEDSLAASIDWDGYIQVDLVRKGAGIEAQVSTRLFDQDMTLYYVDDILYLQYGEVIRMKLATADMQEVIDKIQTLLAEMNQGVVPDLPYDKLLPQSYIDFFENATVDELIAGIDGLKVSDDGNTVAIRYAISEQDKIICSVTKDETNITGASLSGLRLLESDLTAEIDVRRISEDVLPIEVFEEDRYLDLAGLTDFIDPISALVQAVSYEFDVAVEMHPKPGEDQSVQDILQQLQWDGNIHVALTRGENNAIAAQTTAQLLGRELAVTYLDGTAYLQFGEIQLRMAVADADAIVQKIESLVMQITGEGLPEMDFSQFVPQSYLDFIENLSVQNILNNIYGLGLSEDGNTVSLHFKLGEDLITCAVTKAEREGGDMLSQVSLDGLTLIGNSTSITVDVQTISQEPLEIGVDDPEAYVDLNQLADFADPIASLLSAKSYEFTASVSMNKTDADTGLDLEQDIHVTLVRKDGETASGNPDDGSFTLPMDVSLTTEIFGKTLEVTYLDDVAYLRLGDALKFKLDARDVDMVTERIKSLIASINGGKCRRWISANWCPRPILTSSRI